MPTTPSAVTTVNASAVSGAVAVSAGSTVTLALSSTFGVRSVSYTIVGNSSSTLTNPTITLGADFTATFTVPSGTNQGYLIETKINNGRDELGRFASGYKFRFVVGVVGGTGAVPGCLGEKTERGTYGWLELMNAAAGSVRVPLTASRSSTGTDAGKTLVYDGSSDITYTVDDEHFAPGYMVRFVLTGSGSITIAATGTATVTAAPGQSLILDGRHSQGLLVAHGQPDDTPAPFSFVHLGGDPKVVPNAQTGTSYTLTASDSGKLVTLTNGSAIALTLPQNTTENLPVNFQCGIYQGGAGQVTVGKEGSDTIESAGGNLKLTGQGSPGWIWKRGAGDWVLTGDLSA